ncbi:aminoglycoside phosphotransferase [Planomonospora sphaerica]|uniref:Aminoglycoside phosphotransferase n=1 Tax=Planomonospora sphaerica TaxID=161355 RepID=A0A171DNV9_9ACTN|nr:aminoglycoside phosphotransferase family protein [Planomonospora sphaerica]GAT70742.1 aminoglycoside phosphotransferase [Planomonospora sphaerica]
MGRERGRTAGAVVTSEGECLGSLGPFPVATPWWADAGPVADHLTEVLGVPVMVLRLVDVRGGDGARDGHVTYHAEAFGRPRDGLLGPPPAGAAGLLRPAARRAGWATASGLRESLEWAREALRAAGRPVSGPVRQVKTWNLSGLFRIPTVQGPVWLKETPGFATWEADAMEALAAVDPEIVPAVVASDARRRRVILDHLPGEDCWEAPAETVRAMTGRWAAAQAAVARRRDGIPDGLPDRTPRALAELAHGLLDGEAATGLSAAELSAARRLADGLPGPAAALEECGLPHTLVHADFHPGNWRSDGRRTAAVDFADCHFGHPALDALRTCEFLPADRRHEVTGAWTAAWAALVPGSDPARALALAGPFARLAYAVRYQEFLDGIETSERVYHEGDPAAEIRAALAAAASLDGGGRSGG